MTTRKRESKQKPKKAEEVDSTWIRAAGVRYPPDLAERIEESAKVEGISLAVWQRRAARAWLDREDRDARKRA